MRKPHVFIYFLWRLLLFLLLASCCIGLIANNGVIQRYALLGFVRDIEIGLWKKSSKIKDYFELNDINAELSKSNFKLLEQNRRYKEILDSLGGEKLITQVDSAFNDGYSYIWATVVKNMVNTSHNYIIINKGRNDGILPDMGVITPNGAVGIVRGVGKHHSYVLSMINSSQQISVNVGARNTLGILKWDGKNSSGAVLSEIPRHIDVKVGDTVRTSGYSSLYPPNIKLGEVVNSKVVKGTTLELSVKLFQDFRELEYVVVVKNNNRQEIDSLSTTL